MLSALVLGICERLINYQAASWMPSLLTAGSAGFQQNIGTTDKYIACSTEITISGRPRLLYLRRKARL